VYCCTLYPPTPLPPTHKHHAPPPPSKTQTPPQIALGAKRVAVIGIKTEDKPEQPAFYVPEYLQRAGVEIVPVPVYFPDVTEILGRKVYRKVADIPGACGACGWMGGGIQPTGRASDGVRQQLAAG